MSESQKQQVVQHFLNFLQSEINTGNENAESLQVAQEMLKNLYNIQTVTASNHLVELVSSSSSGAATTTTTSPASSSSSYNVETDVKFQEFLKLISEKGYFKNAEKGTPLYEDRFQKAKEKFITKEAEKHKDQGNALLKEHKFAQAIESYAKAIELNPANAIYYANTAVVYLQLKDYNKTIEFSKKAIQADKTYIKAYKWLAMAYEKLDMWDEAIQQYEAALQIDPQNKELETKLSQAKSRPTSSPATTSAPRQSAPSGFPGFPGMPGMPAMPGMGGGMPAGFDQILSNPNFMSMVNNIVQQPGFQQAMESMMKGFTGGGAGGEEGGAGAGAGGLPFDTAMLEQMPEVQQSERLQGIIKEIKAGGLPALMKYQADPEFSQLAQKVLQKTLGSGFNPFAAFGGGGAGAGGKDNDEDDSSGSMYS